ncbi:MAG: hypothetical protein MUO50_02430 [Longimicrobiales bacterium]|nr:hypothetical protein [Longimicrobiales bacterium]
MTRQSQASRSSDPIPLSHRAMEDLRFIRRTMENGNAFTAVPGWGGVGMGVTALAATAIAAGRATPEGWLGVWAAEAVVAAGIGSWAVARKARRVGLPVLSGTGRKVLLGFTPAALAGIVVTAALWQAGVTRLIPGAWLLLYGVAVVAGGTFSVRAVPLMGVCFMLLGTLALLLLPDVGNTMMALGFGGLHLVFGAFIARRHGG